MLPFVTVLQIRLSIVFRRGPLEEQAHTMVITDIVQHDEHDWQEGVLGEQGHELGQHARVNDSLPIRIRVGAGVTGEPQYL